MLLDGERVLSCLALAVVHDGEVTPGRICSAVGVLQEAERGWPSHVTADLCRCDLPVTLDKPLGTLP